MLWGLSPEGAVRVVQGGCGGCLEEEGSRAILEKLIFRKSRGRKASVCVWGGRADVSKGAGAETDVGWCV